MPGKKHSIDHLVDQKKTRSQRFLVSSFNALRIMADPEAFQHDRHLRIRSMLDKKIEFYLVHGLNRDLTAAQKQKWFGTENIKFNDITWQNLENILRPSARENAVYRVNDALEGSAVNEMFAAESKGFAYYKPRTVTVYDSEEQAKAAAAVLRLLTKDRTKSDSSTATITAEKLSDKTLSGTWVVSDDMTLFTHNNIRRVMVHLFEKISIPAHDELTAEVQAEVNTRLLKPEKGWEAYRGVGTFLTLAGRPGVKMYETTVIDGKTVDDPADVKRLSLIHPQREAALTYEIPDSVNQGADGQNLLEDSSATLKQRSFFGTRVLNFIKSRKYKAPGELLAHELKHNMHVDYNDGSVFGNIAALPMYFYNAEAISHHAGFKGLGIAAATIITPILYACGSVTEFTYSFIKETTGTDPLNTKLKSWVEKKTGYNFTEDGFHKTWTFREPQKDTKPAEKLAHEYTADELPLTIEDTHPILWTERIISEGQQFTRFMTAKGLWPSENILPTDAPSRQKVLEATDAYAQAYAVQMITVLRYAHKARTADGDTNREYAAKLDSTFDALRITLLESEKYHSTHHSQYLNDVTLCIVEGFRQFANERTKSAAAA